MNYNDYKAAVDRLRRVASGEDWGEIYSSPTDRSLDKLTIYDAEHDREPATVEWCKEIGFEHYAGVECPTYQLGGLRVTDIEGEIFFCHGNASRLNNNPTRGDVLTALRLF